MKVVRVPKTEFELEDGMVYDHPVELDDAPSLEDFQAGYRQSDIEKLQGIEQGENDRNWAAVYVRVSLQDQKQKGGLDRQKARLLEYCATKKYKVEAVLVDVCSGM